MLGFELLIAPLTFALPAYNAIAYGMLPAYAHNLLKKPGFGILKQRAGVAQW